MKRRFDDNAPTSLTYIDLTLDDDESMSLTPTPPVLPTPTPSPSHGFTTIAPDSLQLIYDLLNPFTKSVMRFVDKFTHNSIHQIMFKKLTLERERHASIVDMQEAVKDTLCVESFYGFGDFRVFGFIQAINSGGNVSLLRWIKHCFGRPQVFPLADKTLPELILAKNEFFTLTWLFDDMLTNETNKALFRRRQFTPALINTAIQNNNIPALKWLQDRGALFTIEVVIANFNIPTVTIDTLKWLLTPYYSSNTETWHNCFDPIPNPNFISKTIRTGNLDKVKLIYGYSSRVFSDEFTRNTESIFTDAIHCGNLQLVKWLRMFENTRGQITKRLPAWTLCNIALEYGQIHIFQYFIKRKDKVWPWSKEGERFLNSAIRSSDPKMIQFVLGRNKSIWGASEWDLCLNIHATKNDKVLEWIFKQQETGFGTETEWTKHFFPIPWNKLQEHVYYEIYQRDKEMTDRKLAKYVKRIREYDGNNQIIPPFILKVIAPYG